MTAPRRAATRRTPVLTLLLIGGLLGFGVVGLSQCSNGAMTPQPTVTVTDPPHQATRIQKVPTTPISCKKALDLADRAHKITDGPMDARAAEQLADVLADYRTHRDQCRKTT